MKPIQRQTATKWLPWLQLLSLFAGIYCTQGQTYTVLHTFSPFAPPPPAQGGTPVAGLVLSNNTLYGTTEFGGNGDGTVFAVGTDGSSYTNLHTFSSTIAPPPSTNQDGGAPEAALLVSGDLLYGTTQLGGSNAAGTVFVATMQGAVTTLYSFTGRDDGANPVASLILSGATLYGTAKSGGKSYSGTVFAINTDGTEFTNLYTFTNGTDGAYPSGALVLSGDTLYGTAVGGGDNSYGTVFSLKTNGSGFASLHSFTGDDGGAPMAAVTLSGEMLYGTTSEGGIWFNGGLFAIDTVGSNFTNFYSFTGLDDGSAPVAPLTLSNNVLYGTASHGGQGDSGTIFAVNTDGSNFTTLYSFTGGTDGMAPKSSLFLTNNLFYGTTEYGGAFSNGTVFAVAANGTGFTNLYSFTGYDDGADPVAGVVGDALYGTTASGGNAGAGTLFIIQTDGAGFATLHSFLPPAERASETNSDGSYPVASLLLAGDTLYGTAPDGGAWGNGTVFAVKTNGSGFTTLYTFTAGTDGARPVANLILSGNTLYGTTEEGGLLDNGTIFSLDTNGSNFKVLYRFSGLDDGGNPAAGLVLSGNTLYGTAEAGGIFYGTVFAINTNGTAFRTVYTFNGGEDGSQPQSSLTLAGDTLYGTAESGGSNGWGTVFSVQTNGTNFMLLHSFTGKPQGGTPYGSLLLLDNVLYGTTFTGGISNNGTVFALQADGIGFTNLYSFVYGNGGAEPAAGLVLSSNASLYGTIEVGGTAGNGAIFAIQTDGMGFTNVHSFVPYATYGTSINSDGAYPLAGLLSAQGTFYGTAYAGGSGGAGTVFSMLTNGSNFATLYSFTNGSDGAFPQAGLIRRSNTLFSTTVAGGSFGKGVIFALQTNGTGFTNLHSFGEGNDGAYPSGSLLLWSNVLYGTASSGGLSNSGTIFSLNPDGSDYKTLYHFTGGSDGAAPLASLAVWSNSWLLCTASAGGISNNGTLFAIKMTPTAQITKLDDFETWYYDFLGGDQGDYPSGTPTGCEDDCGDCCSYSCCAGSHLTTLKDPYFYVLTSGRGVSGDYGTINTFTFNQQTGFLQTRYIHFTEATGGGPDANLLRWNNYGWLTTESGGASGNGCISTYNYSNPNVQSVYNFAGGNFGSVPTGNLIGYGNSLYGAAAYDGPGAHGVLFSYQPCDRTLDFRAPTITAAIYNSSSESLLINYSGSVPTSSPNDPTLKMWGTVYNAMPGNYSALKTFDFSTSSGGAFTDTYRFRTMTMPSTVALSFSSLCGESAYSSSVPVSLVPKISYKLLPGNQCEFSWLASSINYVVQYSSTLDRDAKWIDLTSPAPTFNGSRYFLTHEWYVLPLKTGFTGSFFQFQSGQLEGRTDPLISQAAEALVVGQLAAHHFKVLRADEL